MTRLRVVRGSGEDRFEAVAVWENKMVSGRYRVKNSGGFKDKAAMLERRGEPYSDAREIALGTWTGK